MTPPVPNEFVCCYWNVNTPLLLYRKFYWFTHTGMKTRAPWDKSQRPRRWALGFLGPGTEWEDISHLALLLLFFPCQI